MTEHLPFQVFSQTYDDVDYIDANEPRINVSCLYKSGKFYLTVKKGDEIMHEVLEAEKQPIQCKLSQMDVNKISDLSEQLIETLVAMKDTVTIAATHSTTELRTA